MRPLWVFVGSVGLLLLSTPASGVAGLQQSVAQSPSLQVSRATVGSNSPAVARSSSSSSQQHDLTEQSQQQGRRLKQKLRRGAISLIVLLLLLKSALAMPLLLGGVALAAFKGLWTGTTALTMTAAMALRHLMQAPRVVVAGGGGGGVPYHHHHYSSPEYVSDYRRADDFRDDYTSSGSRLGLGETGGWK